MTRIPSWPPAVWSLALLVLFANLAGCRAMRTHDIYGEAYRNDTRDFYAWRKTAEIHMRSFAFAYQSGDLVGECLVDDSLIRDRVSIDYHALFIKDRSDLTASGQLLLEQFVTRLKRYERIRKVSLRGHTDRDASISYNLQLAARRNQTVQAFLAVRLPEGVPFERFALGEANSVVGKAAAQRFDPRAWATGEDDLAPDRRVLITVEAEDVRRDVHDPTLCHKRDEARLREEGERLDFEPVTYKSRVERENRLDPYRGQLPLSIGDRIRIDVVGDGDFSGIYEIDRDGSIALPYVGAVPAAGSTVIDFRNRVESMLTEVGLFRRGLVRVNLAVQQFAIADIFVRGAVFAPGRRTINGAKADERTFRQTQVAGNFPRERYISTALQAAGGIRPDADLANVHIRRGEETIAVDLAGVFNGYPATDFPLIDGDEVIVPSTGVFREDLIRPTQLTVPGINIFISNTAVPVLTNTQAAVDGYGTPVPYGTRLLRGAVSANCVGGSRATNAARRVVLISTNPLNGATEVIERSVQQLISDPDRDEINPFLMPNDGIACYDSGTTNIRDVARAFSEVLNPMLSLRILLGY